MSEINTNTKKEKAFTYRFEEIESKYPGVVRVTITSGPNAGESVNIRTVNPRLSYFNVLPKIG